MLASSLEEEYSDDVSCESVGNSGYLQRHNAQMFEEGRSFSGNERDKLYFNRGDNTFADLSDLSGCDSPNDGRAVIACDFDDDGDVDLFVHELQRERHALYRNELGTQHGGFLKLRLQATSGQWEAIGATVLVQAGELKAAQVLSRGAGFASCQAPELVFGLGASEQGSVTVIWPGGTQEEFGNLEAGGRALLVEGTGTPKTIEALTTRLPDPLPEGLKLNVGHQVPTLGLVDAAGQETQLDVSASTNGDEIYLNLWASYCAPCVGELPLLERLHQEEGKTVLAISVDAPGQRELASTLLSRRGTTFPGYYLGATPQVDSLLDLDRLPIPTTLVLSPEGQIKKIIRGPIQEDD